MEATGRTTGGIPAALNGAGSAYLQAVFDVLDRLAVGGAGAVVAPTELEVVGTCWQRRQENPVAVGGGRVAETLRRPGRQARVEVEAVLGGYAVLGRVLQRLAVQFDEQLQRRVVVQCGPWRTCSQLRGISGRARQKTMLITGKNRCLPAGTSQVRWIWLEP